MALASLKICIKISTRILLIDDFINVNLTNLQEASQQRLTGQINHENIKKPRVF